MARSGKGNVKPGNNRNKGGKLSSKTSNGNFSSTVSKRGKQKSVTGGNPFRDELTDRNSTKTERRGVEIADTGAKLAESNPVAYYTKFSKFSRDAATLPFSLPLGAFFKDIYNTAEVKSVIPGIMRIQFTPTIGASRDFTSAINRASVRFYTYLRSNQKASAAYDHQDISMMEVALDSCYMFHALCSRIYGIVRDFTPINEYYSRALIAASGASFDDVKANLQNFRAWINTFAYNLGQYSMPAKITLFGRHRWMCEGLYTDGKTEKAQTYIFVPNGFWQYDNTVTTGSQCTFKQYLAPGTATTQYTVAQLMQFGNELLNAISGDEDFAVISGDIYNFYGGDMFKLPYIDENYAILPAYEEVVLSQIENLTLVPELLVNGSNLVISQNPSVNNGAIIFNPTITTANISKQRMFMNFHHDSPSPDDVIEASRLMVTMNKDGAKATIQQCGTEIVTQLDIFSRNPATGGFRSNPIERMWLAVTTTTEASRFVNIMADMALLAQFDWAPCMRVYNQPDPNKKEYSMLGWTWDVDNMQYIAEEYIDLIHTACLFSLFEVGDNGFDVVDNA